MKILVTWGVIVLLLLMWNYARHSIPDDEIDKEIKFNFKCFILGHKYINGNIENDSNWCDRCLRSGWIK